MKPFCDNQPSSPTVSALYYYFYKRTALSIADPRCLQYSLDSLRLKQSQLKQICFKQIFDVAFMKNIKNNSNPGFTRTWAGWSRRVLPDRNQLFLTNGQRSFQTKPRISKPIVPIFWHFPSLSSVTQAFTVGDSVCVRGIAFTMCQMWSNIMWCYTLLTEKK